MVTEKVTGKFKFNLFYCSHSSTHVYTNNNSKLQAVDDFVCFDEIFSLFARASSDANKLSTKIAISLLSWGKRKAKNIFV